MVPNGWSQTRLENIAKIKSGSTPLRAKQDLYFSEDGTPWVKTLDLNNSEIIVTDERITELALKETSCSILPANTVLVAMYGGFNQIGRTGLLTQPSAINQALSGLILDLERAEPKYVLDYLNGNVGQWKKFAASSRKDPNITRQDVCSFEILLPPLPEQQKIAKILSTWDKAISTTERLIDNSTQQKKALMQQLLTGKKRLLDDEGKIFEGEWEEVTLESVFPVIDSLHQTPKFSSSGYPMIRVTDIKGGNLSLKNALCVDEEVFEEYTKKYQPKKGDIVFSRVGSYGNSSIVNTDDLFCLGQNTVIASSNSCANNFFIYQFLNAGFIKRQIERTVDGSSHKTVSLKIIRNLILRLPSVQEQNKIATVLTNADKEIELLEQQLADLQQEKKALMQVLLTGKKRVLVDGEVL